MVTLNALVIVDAQKDFDKWLSPDVVAGITRAVAFARRMHFKVIWVYSHYHQAPRQSSTSDGDETTATAPSPAAAGDAPQDGGDAAAAAADEPGRRRVAPAEDLDAFIKQTHTGRTAFCVPGSDGAAFSDKVKHLIDTKRDVTLRKSGYSAFRETNLQSILKRGHVGHVMFAGVTTNVCVMATSYHAAKLGYGVTVLSDCTNAFSAKKHQHGLEQVPKYGGQVLMLSEAERRFTSFAEKARLLHGVISPDVLDLDFDRLRREIVWCEMISHGNPVPRAVAIQGTVDPARPALLPLYRHPVELQPRLVPWTPMVSRIRDMLSAKLGVNLNHALIQHYRDGEDYIGEHSDKTVDIAPATPIVNFTVGATRHMLLRRKGVKGVNGVMPEGSAQRVPLTHNSAFVFDLESNATWLHEIRPNRRVEAEMQDDEKIEGGARISFTFRQIGSFLDTSTGHVTGQGARKRSSGDDDGGDGQQQLVDDSATMHQAMGAENRQAGEFDWAAHYGGGFDAVYVSNGLSREFIEPSRSPDVTVKPAQLHYVSGSVPSWRVEVVLRELGVPYERVREKVMVRLSDKLKALNQRQLTPTLVDVDGTVHRESFAIIQYLHASRGNTSAAGDFEVFPRDPLLLSRAMELAYAADDWRVKQLGPFEHALLDQSGHYKDWTAEGAAGLSRMRDAVFEQWSFWEDHVLGRAAEWGGGQQQDEDPAAAFSGPLLGGGKFTIADVGFLPVLAYALHRGGFAIAAKRFPRTLAYYQRWCDRPSFVGGAPEFWDLKASGSPDLFVRCEQILLGVARREEAADKKKATK